MQPIFSRRLELLAQLKKQNPICYAFLLCISVMHCGYRVKLIAENDNRCSEVFLKDLLPKFDSSGINLRFLVV